MEAGLMERVVHSRIRDAENVKRGDWIEDGQGELREVVAVRTFEPYDSVQISCRGHYVISTRKGREHTIARGV